MKRTASVCSGPVSRRAFLSTGTLGIGGLGLGELLRLRADAAQAGTSATELDTSIIFVWLPGGPPHMERFSAKFSG